MGLTREERARVGQLRLMLIGGRLAPGVSHDYAAWAAELETDADGVRAAVAELARDGLVEMMPDGAGFVVRAQPDRPDETVEVRLLMEPQATREAASRARVADLLSLRRLATDMEAAAARADFEGFRAAHDGFHATLIACHPNSRLVDLVNELAANTRTDGMRQVVEAGLAVPWGAEHATLVDLIEAGALDGVETQVVRWLGELRYLGAPRRGPGEPERHVDPYPDDLVPCEGDE